MNAADGPAGVAGRAFRAQAAADLAHPAWADEGEIETVIVAGARSQADERLAGRDE